MTNKITSAAIDGKPHVSRRFSVTIHDDNGEMSMDIYDQNTKTQTTLTAEDFNLAKNTGFNIGTIAKILITEMKSKYINIINRKK
jgi:hypothetical protein